MIDYKKAGLKAFNKGEFEAAASYFSLAYDKKPDKKLLFLIMLCSLAKIRRDEAMTLFEIFKLKDKLGMSPDELEEILGALEAKFSDDESLEEQNAISRAINDGLRGATLEVMVEGASKNDKAVWSGRTRTNKIVLFPHGTEQEGDFVQVRITQPQTWVLKGEIAH